MDDYSISSLSESKNEWCARLVNTLTPATIGGLKSIFQEAWNVCIENDEEDKYLMTFQTFLSRVPKWNAQMISDERKRIEEDSGCGYLEELITCVHVIQLKALTCVRVGHKQKKVDIDVPSADEFIHRVYTNVARKLYTNVYLFEKDINALEVQKHNRELEIIIKECILNAVRDTMPVEKILRAYMDETEEQDVDVKEEILVKSTPEIVDNQPSDTVSDTKSGTVSDTKSGTVSGTVSDTVSDTASDTVSDTVSGTASDTVSNTVSNTLSDNNMTLRDNIAINTEERVQSLLDKSPEITNNVAPSIANEKLTFSNIDNAIDTNGIQSTIEAPKTAERLQQIEAESAERDRQENNDDDDGESLKIGSDISLSLGDINDLNRSVSIIPPPPLEGVEILDPI